MFETGDAFANPATGLGRKAVISMLSKTAEYALRAAVCLAQDGQPIYSAQILASITKVPRRYLHKVVQDLVAGGLVKSQPGPGGGYSLAKPATKVTILDVINAVAPIERITHCPLGLPSHTSLCPLHKQLDDVYASTQNVLGKVTLDQVVRSSSGIVPLCDVRVIDGKPTQETAAAPAKPSGRPSGKTPAKTPRKKRNTKSSA